MKSFSSLNRQTFYCSHKDSCFSTLHRKTLKSHCAVLRSELGQNQKIKSAPLERSCKTCVSSRGCSASTAGLKNALSGTCGGGSAQLKVLKPSCENTPLQVKVLGWNLTYLTIYEMYYEYLLWLWNLSLLLCKQYFTVVFEVQLLVTVSNRLLAAVTVINNLSDRMNYGVLTKI